MGMKAENLLKTLHDHPDPIIRWDMERSGLIGKSDQVDLHDLQKRLASSATIKGLLCDQNAEGIIPFHPYDKWFGAHWVLSILADLSYPPGDTSLKPLLEQCYAWLLSEEHQSHIKTINGRVRRCASQEGNCIYYSLALGIADGRTEELVDRLIRWQWEDGGWNCDKRPEAAKSSFDETLIPLKGLALYAKETGDGKAKQAVGRASEVFLNRNLFRRISDGKVIDRHFTRLHYPNYWHYDILFALKVMSEAGFLDDLRNKEALDLLASKQLPDGGFPAEERYYRVADKRLNGHSRVDWGGTSKVRQNPFVTIDGLSILKLANYPF